MLLVSNTSTEVHLSYFSIALCFIPAFSYDEIICSAL